MKKIWFCKMSAETRSNTAESLSMDKNDPIELSCDINHDETIFPPLPLDPPPPHRPIPLSTKIKEEMEEDQQSASKLETLDEHNSHEEIENTLNENNTSFETQSTICETENTMCETQNTIYETENTICETENTVCETESTIHETENVQCLNESTTKNTKTMPMCRNFFRGTCNRPCTYSHEPDYEQLKLVYTFCHNFQNSVCKDPSKCEYVHGTIFEEQRFYRTGLLPPRTLAHIKKTGNKEIRVPTASGSNPPLPVDSNILPRVQVISRSSSPSRSSSLPRLSSPSRSSSLPRLSSPLRSSSPSSHMGSVISQPPPPYNHQLSIGSQQQHELKNTPVECPNCEVNRWRLQYHEEKFYKALKKAQESGVVLKLLQRKKEKLYTVLHFLLTQRILIQANYYQQPNSSH